MELKNVCIVAGSISYSYFIKHFKSTTQIFNKRGTLFIFSLFQVYYYYRVKFTALNGVLESSFLPGATSEFMFGMKLLFFVQSHVSDEIFVGKDTVI